MLLARVTKKKEASSKHMDIRNIQTQDTEWLKSCKHRVLVSAEPQVVICVPLGYGSIQFTFPVDW